MPAVSRGRNEEVPGLPAQLWGIRILEDKQCGEAEFDASRYECSNAHAQKFDPTLGIVLIAIGVLLTIVIAATSSSQQPQMP